MKLKKGLILIVLCIILSISLTGCSTNQKGGVLKEKIASELTYLDTKLIELINATNGLSLENYIVKAEKIEEEGANTDTSGKSSSTSEETAEESPGTSSETGEESGSSSSGGQSNTENVNYRLEGNEILLQDRTPKWNDVKAEIEKMYADWSTIMLDLYEANVSSQDILNFNTDLDVATRQYKSRR